MYPIADTVKFRVGSKKFIANFKSFHMAADLAVPIEVTAYTTGQPVLERLKVGRTCTLCIINDGSVLASGSSIKSPKDTVTSDDYGKLVAIKRAMRQYLDDIRCNGYKVGFSGDFHLNVFMACFVTAISNPRKLALPSNITTEMFRAAAEQIAQRTTRIPRLHEEE